MLNICFIRISSFHMVGQVRGILLQDTIIGYYYRILLQDTIIGYYYRILLQDTGKKIGQNSFLCANFFKGKEGSLIFQSLNNLFTVHKYEFVYHPCPQSCNLVLLRTRTCPTMVKGFALRKALVLQLLLLYDKKEPTVQLKIFRWTHHFIPILQDKIQYLQ